MGTHHGKQTKLFLQNILTKNGKRFSSGATNKKYESRKRDFIFIFLINILRDAKRVHVPYSSSLLRMSVSGGASFASGAWFKFRV